jgi:hypothetical protein
MIIMETLFDAISATIGAVVGATFAFYLNRKRNKQMAEISDYVICFWDGKSKGTRSMIEYTEEYNKPIKIKMI